MTWDTPAAPVTQKMFWIGCILSALPVLVLIMSGVMKLVQPDGMEKEFEKLGWDIRLALGLGIVELVCTLIYLIPRTSVLGAILLTGYFGGAVATHVRLSDPVGPITPVVLGVLVWGGLYLRDSRLRTLLPLRS